MTTWQYLLTVGSRTSFTTFYGYSSADVGGGPMVGQDWQPDTNLVGKTIGHFLGIAFTPESLELMFNPVFASAAEKDIVAALRVPALGIDAATADLVFTLNSGSQTKYRFDRTGIVADLGAQVGNPILVEVDVPDDLTLTAATLGSGRVGFEAGDAGSLSLHRYLGKYPIDELSTDGTNLRLVLDTADVLFADYFGSINITDFGIFNAADATFDGTAKSWTWSTAEQFVATEEYEFFPTLDIAPGSIAIFDQEPFTQEIFNRELFTQEVFSQ